MERPGWQCSPAKLYTLTMVWKQVAASRKARVKARFGICFKAEPIRFTDGLNVGCERRGLWPKQWEEWSFPCMEIGNVGEEQVQGRRSRVGFGQNSV